MVVGVIHIPPRWGAMQAISDVMNASPLWIRAWASLESADPEFARSLDRLGLAKPLTWAGLAKGSGVAMQKVELMLRGQRRTSTFKTHTIAFRRAVSNVSLSEMPVHHDDDEDENKQAASTTTAPPSRTTTTMTTKRDNDNDDDDNEGPSIDTLFARNR